jgi:galactoside O-acetyltransferase
VHFGKNVYANFNLTLVDDTHIYVGDYTKFGPNVTVIDNDHLFTQEGVQSGLVSSPISIGKNCWIGANVVILKGTVIGENCIIGAGCIVKGTIPAGSIVTQDRKLNTKPIE